MPEFRRKSGRFRFREHLLSVSGCEPVFCILTMTHEHMLHISDHCLLRQQNLRSWACVRPKTSGNISETHLPRTIKSKEQNCSTVAALLESAILSGEIIPRISSDNERLKFSRPFQQVLSALILSCGLASINHSVLVTSSTRGPSLASKEIDRKND